VVAATHLDLRALLVARRFRADLEARLTGVEIDLPPLRERREDLGLLVAAILARTPGGAEVTFDAAAARQLLAHDWPKNIRELEQAVTSAAVLAGGRPIAVRHLPRAVAAATFRKAAAPTDPVAEELARQLDAHAGNVSAIARAMGKTRKQIQRWLKRFGMNADAYRDR
jgi:DNA-binding NtrC family response regulator